MQVSMDLEIFMAFLSLFEEAAPTICLDISTTVLWPSRTLPKYRIVNVLKHHRAQAIRQVGRRSSDFV